MSTQEFLDSLYYGKHSKVSKVTLAGLTQEDKKELQKYANVPEIAKVMNGRVVEIGGNGDTGVSTADAKTLYDTVEKLRSSTDPEHDYIKAVLTVSKIIKRNYSGNKTGKVATTTIKTNKETGEEEEIKGMIKPNPDRLPILIKQVIFYLAVFVIDKKFGDQKKVLDDLMNLYGVSFSHNFFSRYETSPQDYIYFRNYKQPELVTNYMGQKHGDLAVAINNLVYQAGDYARFVDVFGGSGAASVAFPKHREKKYIYNEKNPDVANLFEVLTSNDYKLLIAEVEALKNALRGIQPWEPIPQSVVDDFYNREKGRKTNAEQRLYFRQYDKLTQDDIDKAYSSCVKTLQNIEGSKLITDPPSPYFPLKTDKKSYWVKKFSSGEHVLDYDLISFCDNFYNADGYRNKVCVYAYNEMNYRFYEYYAYFTGVLKSTAYSKVHRALAKLYSLSFVTKGKEDISAICRFRPDTPVKSETNALQMFLKKDHAKVIRGLHKRCKGIYVMTKDCIHAIRDTSSNKTLYYADSPYIATADYKDTDAFNEAKMHELIDALIATDGKFIFSCRAIKSKDAGTRATAKKIAELADANAAIVTGVLFKFMDYVEQNKQFYVLVNHVLTKKEKKAISMGGSEADKVIKNEKLLTAIEKNKIIELMITNYPIYPIEGTSYSVYKLEDFCLKLMLYADVLDRKNISK